MELTNHVAVCVLAATDAVFIPDRDPRAAVRHVALYERRRDYPTLGVPWASDKVALGLDDAGRKQVQRTLEHLAASGMVQTFRPRHGKTLAVKLTDVGETRARALVGLPPLSAGLAELDRLHRLLTDAADKTGCEFLGRVWTPETAFTATRWGDRERRHLFVELEERFLPVLVRRLADSNCSIQGHCWYSINPEGFDLAKRRAAGGAAEPAAENLPARDDEARYLYYGQLKEELAALHSAELQCEREIGEIPMPVCPLPRIPAPAVVPAAPV